MAQALGLLPRHIRRALFFTSTAGAFVVLVATLAFHHHVLGWNMDARYHYPPDVFNLLVDTIPLLCRIRLMCCFFCEEQECLMMI